MKNRAFTLIELLVVVLIIGILASIALPQYQKAVMKTRYASLKTLTRSIAEAEEVFYMANNTYSVDFEELDVQMPGGKLNSSTASYYHYDWGDCKLTHGGDISMVQCYNELINMSFQIRFKYSNGYPGRYACIARGSTSSNTLQAQICKAETGLTNPSATSQSDKYTTWRYLN
ncbi:MAG: prepilin-type N-terminal cleavage/methylation domain-containing protein [Elusimicrobiaceae bacterium]|nr:prepilin-type N-terminal cleavage/methylation domain-containing protein [Elusimicrobiaceae bacterium]